jgi:lipoate-protein ligase B
MTGGARSGGPMRVRWLGRVPYREALAVQQALSDHGREQHLLLLEHDHVFTYGQHADLATNLRCDPAAVGADFVAVNRGGDITYHGPGQVVLYALVDLARRGIKVKRFVWLLEQAVIDLLGRGERRPGAPGVYVDGAKIAALGIRVSRGRSYHGLALNVDMDLAPFSAIDPCGYPGLRVTQLKDLGIATEGVRTRLADHLISVLDHE